MEKKAAADGRIIFVAVAAEEMRWSASGRNLWEAMRRSADVIMIDCFIYDVVIIYDRQ